MERQEKLAKLTQRLGQVADYPIDRVSASTRLYHDAGLAGDDYWDFMVWFSHEFRVALNGMDLRDFSPPEGWPWPWRRSRSNYKELRLADLIELSEFDSWEQSGMSARLASS